MFFDSVDLSTKSWHYRLQHWTFPDVPKFRNFCPYFWLTIFCMLMAPITLALNIVIAVFRFLWRAILKPFLFVFLPPILEKFVGWLDKALYEPSVNGCNNYWTNRLLSHPSDELLKDFKRIQDSEINYGSGYCNWQRDWESYEKTKKLFDTWRERTSEDTGRDNLLNAAAERIRLRNEELDKAREARRQAASEAEIKRQQTFTKIATHTKTIFTGIMYLVGAGILFGAAWLGTWFFITVNVFQNLFDFVWNLFTDYIPWVFMGLLLGLKTMFTFIFSAKVGVIVLFVLALAAIVWLLSVAISKCVSSLVFRKYGGATGQFIVTIFKAIGSVFHIFWVFMKTIKSNNCPKIEWKD